MQVCVLDGQDSVVEESRMRLRNTELGQEVMTRLTQWRTGGRFVVEAVGCNRWFVNACRAAGISIVVADALALVRSQVWRYTHFSLSQKDSDLIQIPRPLFECLTDTLCYAA